MSDELDDDHPLWLTNEQIKGLLEGDGASEDHEDVLVFLRSTGLPESTVRRMHKALSNRDAQLKQAFRDEAVEWTGDYRGPVFRALESVAQRMGIPLTRHEFEDALNAYKEPQQ